MTIPGELPPKEDQEARWSWQDAVRKAREEVAKRGFPMPKPPSGMGKDYEFPTDAASLSDVALGKLMLQLAAWHSYTVVQLGWADAEKSALESIMNVVIGNRVVEAMKVLDRKPDKDSMKAAVIEATPSLKSSIRVLVEMETKVRHYQALVDLYSIQFNALSRELSRRQALVQVTR